MRAGRLVVDGQIEGKSEGVGDRDADADAGERARTRVDLDAGDVGGFEGVGVEELG